MILVARGDVTDERKVTSALDGRGQLALVKRAVARDPAWNDLAVLGNKGLHHADIFIIHHEVLIRAEAANLLAMESTATTTTVIAVFVHAIATITAVFARTFVTHIGFQISNSHD